MLLWKRNYYILYEREIVCMSLMIRNGQISQKDHFGANGANAFVNVNSSMAWYLSD